LSNETLTLTFSGTDTYAGITGKCEIELIFEALESLFTIKTAEWGDAQSNLGPGQILNYAMLSNYKVYDTYDPSFNDPTKINGINFCLGQSESLNVPDYSYVEKPDGSIDYTLTDVSSVYDSYVGIVNLKNTVPSTKLNLDNVFVKNKPTSATKERQYNFYDLGGNHFISTPSVNDILLE
jgi:hypothetical protein